MRQRNCFGKTEYLTKTALYAAVVCIIGPIAIPLGFSPVPVSLFSLAVYLFAYCLVPVEIMVGTAVYLLLGAVGLPVFAGAQGGVGHIIGPTGGYLIGYLLLAGVCSWFDQRYSHHWGLQMTGMLFGTTLLYLIGTAWFVLCSGSDWVSALGVCVLPYLPTDFVKMILSAAVGPMIAQRLQVQKRTR